MQDYANGYTAGRTPMILKPLRRYGEFGFDPANRVVAESHAAKLADSADSLYLFDLYPIVATTEGVIVDGQHRFTVARDMMIPYYAIRGDDITIEDVAEANSNTHKFDSADALAVYASMGVPSYCFFRDFLLRNPHVVLKDAMRWFTGDRGSAEFIEGSFVASRPEYAQVVADRIKDFMGIRKWVATSPPYKRAITNLSLNPLYDHGRMMDRLEAAPARLERVVDLDEAYANLNRIYNYNKSRANQVELLPLHYGQLMNRFDKGDMVPREGLAMPVRGIAYQRQVEVYSANDLSRFTIHPSARAAQEKRLTNMIDFIKRRNLLRYYPILVDQNYVVLDGQLRFLAAKELNFPIYFIVTNQFSLHMALIAAGLAKKWNPTNYLSHFCTRGYEDYLYMKQYSEKFPFINLPNAIRFCSSQASNLARMDFEQGNYRADCREKAERFGVILRGLGDARLKRQYLFQTVVFNLLDNPTFDGNRLVERLNKLPDLLGAYGNTEECIEAIEKVVNAGRPAERRVQLSYMERDEQKARVMA